MDGVRARCGSLTQPSREGGVCQLRNTPSIPQMGDLRLPFDEAIKKLEGLAGFNLKPDQRRALEELYMGSDLCATGFGKMSRGEVD